MPNSLAGQRLICAGCMVEERDPRAAKRRAHRALMAELGMPDDALVWQVTHRGVDTGKGWAGYTVEMFGMSVGHLPVPCPWPFWRLSASGGTGAGIVVQLWRQQVRLAESPAYLEARWHPERGETVQLLGLERVAKLEDASKVLRGLRLLRLIDQRGRPRKAKTASEEEARAEQHKVKRAIKRMLEDGEAYNRSDIELFVYAVEQGGKFLAQKIAPARFSELEAEVLRRNRDLAKVKRRNVRRVE
jgi:hypothetical protein